MANRFTDHELPRWRESGIRPMWCEALRGLLRHATSCVPAGCTVTIPASVLQQRTGLRRTTTSSMQTAVSRLRSVDGVPNGLQVRAIAGPAPGGPSAVSHQDVVLSPEHPLKSVLPFANSPA